MFIIFTSNDCANPYITTQSDTLIKIILKYELTQLSTDVFQLTARRRILKGYQDKKEVLRSFAQNWQSDFQKFNYSWSELANWCDFFMEYGKKYGLLREFYENGII